MKIKVCGLNDVENIRNLETIAPDFLGLIFYPDSSRCVKDQPVFRNFIRQLDWSKKVGVFVNAPSSKVCQTAERYGLDFVQLHGGETPDYCKRIAGNFKVIKAIAVRWISDLELLDVYRQYCTYVLLDTAGPLCGGSGRKFDWQILSDRRLNDPYFLSGGIGPEDAIQIKSLYSDGLAGIDINSRFECRPGIKNIVLVQKFIHEIRHQ